MLRRAGDEAFDHLFEKLAGLAHKGAPDDVGTGDGDPLGDGWQEGERPAGEIDLEAGFCERRARRLTGDLTDRETERGGRRERG